LAQAFTDSLKIDNTYRQRKQRSGSAENMTTAQVSRSFNMLKSFWKSASFARQCTSLLAMLPLLIAGVANTWAEEYVEGKHYDLISPAIRGIPGKIEVTEFIWYDCGHCYTFVPQLSLRKKSLPDYLVLK